MINWHLANFVIALENLREWRQEAVRRNGDDIRGDDLERLRTDFKYIGKHCDSLGIDAISDRVERVMAYIDVPIGNYRVLLSGQIDPLIEALEDNMRRAVFYHYPRDKADLLIKAGIHWASQLQQFPSIEKDLMAGLDCHALGHAMGCVFYFMRVAEFGLRAIAAERGISIVKNKPVDWATWGDTVDAVEKKAQEIRLTAKAGPNKDAALKFYKSVVSDLLAILDLYRNGTMHLRDDYDEGQAASAIFRVKELMGMLASKLDENATGEIDWGL